MGNVAKVVVITLASLLLGTPIYAITNVPYGFSAVTDIVGDKDGFDSGIVEGGTIQFDAGNLLGAGEVTDGWTYRRLLPLSWEHDFDLTGFTSITEACLELFTGGQGLYGPSQLVVDGEKIGFLSDGEIDGTSYARLDVFDLTPYLHLLGDGQASISVFTQFENHGYEPNDIVGADNWILDYSCLRIRGLSNTPRATVPEPSSALLMATGILSLAAFARKRHLFRR